MSPLPGHRWQQDLHKGTHDPALPGGSDPAALGTGGCPSTTLVRGHPPGTGDTGWSSLGYGKGGGSALLAVLGGRCCGPAVCTRITKYWCSPPEAELPWLRGVPRPHRDAPGGSCPGRAGHRRRPPPAPAGRALTSLRSRPYLHETSATYRELTPRLEAWREKYLAVQ